jgi:peptide deformylase
MILDQPLPSARPRPRQPDGSGGQRRAAWAGTTRGVGEAGRTSLFARRGPRYLDAMTLRKIALLGHPILLGKAAPVEDPSAPEVQALVSDMLATMADADGIGLAAPQVHVAQRIVVALSLRDRAERADAAVHVLINPELTPLGDATELAFEGCLSIPDLRGLVPRHRRVGYRALGRDGGQVQGEAEGLFARVLQHEVDHLDGVLYPMRMPDLRHLAFASELPHLSAWLERPGDAA